MRVNAYLVHWIRDKYERLKKKRRAFECMREIAERYSRMFAHWKWVSEVHVRICWGEIPPGHPTGSPLTPLASSATRNEKGRSGGGLSYQGEADLAVQLQLIVVLPVRDDLVILDVGRTGTADGDVLARSFHNVPTRRK
ncbi:MAG: hypothetical protein QOE54_464 [Streptosporangiaceae bacterium]|nr:hypothetical protein [Streptosporangiaceae bacterium]